MMNKIIIFGGGVAALSIAYHLTQENHPIVLVSPDDHFNVKTDGARFLHVHSSVAFDKLIENCGIEFKECELSGGVTLCSGKKCSHYDWSELISDEDLRLRITHEYAESSGRKWTPSILNNLLNMKQIPKGLTRPTYAQLVEYMVGSVKDSGLCTYENSFVISISLAEQNMRVNQGDNIDYDLLINTVPFWAFKDLLEVHLPVRDQFKYTKSRYCLTESCNPADFFMTYFAGPHIEDLMGLPLKRISGIDSQRIIEFYKKPNNYNEKQLVRLPPNIQEGPGDNWDEVVKHLQDHNVELLGRFAQMRSKMMFTDIIDASFELAQACQNQTFNSLQENN